MIIYEFVANKIIEKLNFLLWKNYQIKEKDFRHIWLDINNHEDLLIVLQNEKIGRKISILYVPVNNEGINNEIFVIQIWNTKKGGIFSIDSFMKLLHKDEYVQLTLRNFEGAFEDKLDQLLDYVVNIMQKYLMDVLEGKKWINVPMDWGGAK